MANPPLHSSINQHFFQPLLPGFTNHLDIPVAFFLKHLEGNNKCKTAKLRSDASETTWRVKIDGRRLSDGWEDFAIAHDIRVGDIVIFRHEGELVFHVTALGPSFCEIQYGGGGYSDDEEDKKEKVSRNKKSPKAETDQSFFMTTVTASNLKRDIVYLPKRFATSNGLMNRFEIVLMNEEGESWKIGLTYESCRDRFYMCRGWRSFCVANKKKPGDMFTFKLVQNEETPVIQMLPLNSEDLHKVEPSDECDTRQGLEATEKEFLGVETNRNDTSQCIEAIRKRKRSKSTMKEENITRSQNRFVTLTATPTSRLNLPLEFTRGNGINNAGKIMMRDMFGIKWSTLLLMNKNERGTMSLGRNWKGFCEVNDVKMGESFDLELVWEGTVPVLMFCSKSEKNHISRNFV